jgi:hypothetical protein
MEDTQMAIEELERKIQELLFLPVINSEGEVVSYADLATYRLGCQVKDRFT